MIFKRKHLQRNLIEDDVRQIRYINNVKVYYQDMISNIPEWKNEEFHISKMIFHFNDNILKLSDLDTSEIIESSNYFTIIQKNKITCLRYEDVKSFEFELY